MPLGDGFLTIAHKEVCELGYDGHGFFAVGSVAGVFVGAGFDGDGGDVGEGEFVAGFFALRC